MFWRRVTDLKILPSKHQIGALEPKLIWRDGDAIIDFIKLTKNCISWQFSNSPTWFHLLLCLHCNLSLERFFLFACLHSMGGVLDLVCSWFWAEFSSQECRWWQDSWTLWWCYNRNDAVLAVKGEANNSLDDAPCTLEGMLLRQGTQQRSSAVQCWIYLA